MKIKALSIPFNHTPHKTNKNKKYKTMGDEKNVQKHGLTFSTWRSTQERS